MVSFVRNIIVSAGYSTLKLRKRSVHALSLSIHQVVLRFFFLLTSLPSRQHNISTSPLNPRSPLMPEPKDSAPMPYSPDSPEAGLVAKNVRTCPNAKVPVSLAYHTMGDPANPAILLINGLNANYLMYDDNFCGMLRDQGPLYVIRFDNRDCGYSTKMTHLGEPSLVKQLFPKCCCCCRVKPVYTLEDMADDAVALLDYLKISKAHILGTSMGGMIAQLVAIRHPARVLTLTSMKSTTGAPDLKPPGFGLQLQLVKGPKKENDLEKDIVHLGTWMVDVMWPTGSIKDPKCVDYSVQWLAGQKRRANYDGGNARQLTAIVQAESRDTDLKGIRCPTLVLHGAEDRLVPLPHGKRTHECIMGSKFVVIEGMAHNFYLPFYPQMVDAILANCKRATMSE